MAKEQIASEEERKGDGAVARLDFISKPVFGGPSAKRGDLWLAVQITSWTRQNQTTPL